MIGQKGLDPQFIRVNVNIVRTGARTCTMSDVLRIRDFLSCIWILSWLGSIALAKNFFSLRSCSAEVVPLGISALAISSKTGNVARIPLISSQRPLQNSWLNVSQWPDSHRKTEKRNLLLHQSPKFGKLERKSDNFVGFIRNCKQKYQAAEELTNKTPSVWGTRTFRPKIVQMWNSALQNQFHQIRVLLMKNFCRQEFQK